MVSLENTARLEQVSEDGLFAETVYALTNQRGFLPYVAFIVVILVIFQTSAKGQSTHPQDILPEVCRGEIEDLPKNWRVLAGQPLSHEARFWDGVCALSKQFRQHEHLLGRALQVASEEFHFLLPKYSESCSPEFLALASEFLELGGLLKINEMTIDGNRQAVEAFEWLSRVEERHSLCNRDLAPPTHRSRPYLALAYLRAGKQEQLTATLKEWAKTLYDDRWSLEAEAIQKVVYDADLYGWPLGDIAMSAMAQQQRPKDDVTIYTYWDLRSRLKGRSLIQLREAFKANRESNDAATFGRFIREFHSNLAERPRPFDLPSETDQAIIDKAISDWVQKVKPLTRHRRTSGVLPSASIRDLVARLPPQVVVADYYRFRPVSQKAGASSLWQDDRYGVFIADASGVEFINLGQADLIDSFIRKARAELSDEKDGLLDHSGKLVLKDAFEALVGPFESRLSSAKGLVISGDSLVSSLPFAPLIDRNGHFLISAMDISYVDTFRELNQEVSSGPVKRGPPVAIVNVNFPKGSRPSHVASISKALLKHAWENRDQIDEQRSTTDVLRKFGARIVSGRAATEQSLRRLRSPRLLHISSHSFRLDCSSVSYEPDGGITQPCPDPSRPPYDFGAEFPSRLPPIEFASPDDLAVRTMQNSAIALSAKRFDVETNDGFLSASEAMELDLRGTQLVFLSSCDSGGGDGTQSEGAYNLRRGFMLAGSAQQIAAAWQIPSYSTSDLTRRFYEALKPDRVAALQSLSLVQRQMSAEKHPYFWAGLRLYGQFDPAGGSR